MLKEVRKCVAWSINELGLTCSDSDADNITSFNDKTITKKKDVLQLLDRAIKKVEDE